MATRSNGASNDKQQNAKLLKLIKLLDINQPYSQFNHSYIFETEIPDGSLIIKRIQGSLIGLAVGDALGASVEFRPYAYLKAHQVTDMQDGGTWGLQAGQWTDDTSMALCLAASLIVKGKCDSYDQLERYRRWYRNGYMSSTGKCFDIGQSTRQAITEFEKDQQRIRKELTATNKKLDGEPLEEMVEEKIRKNVDLRYGTPDSAGNGPLMRLAPIPCFFSSYDDVIKYIDEATQITHGDTKAIDACRFYAGLIWHAINGRSKKEILDSDFYRKQLKITLHQDIQVIAEGSYKKMKRGYEDGIRGKGYIVNALEAALWAFYHDEDKFEIGVLKAVNLGDDTDTTAAIYGELAGAVYGIENIPSRWTDRLYQGKFIMTVAAGLYLTGHDSKNEQKSSDEADANYQTNDRTRTNDTNRDGQRSGEVRTTRFDQHANENSTGQPSQTTNTNRTLHEGNGENVVRTPPDKRHIFAES